MEEDTARVKTEAYRTVRITDNANKVMVRTKYPLSHPPPTPPGPPLLAGGKIKQFIAPAKAKKSTTPKVGLQTSVD